MMLKRELVSEICERTGETERLVRAVLNAFDEVVFEVIGSGGEVFLLSVGKLSVARRKRSIARIVHTNETVSVPAHNTVKFKPSIPLKLAARKAKLS